MTDPDYVRWFADIRNRDVPLVGGKSASLGELYSQLTAEGVRVPNGFALTVHAYYDALLQSGTSAKLHALLDDLDLTDVGLLATRAAAARGLVYEATGGDMLRERIIAAYRQLEAQYGTDTPVAVRSSATAEDLPTASFAGQHESYLNISGADDVVEACRRCFASIFTDRAIIYRANNG
ncbi:MAG TPA: PEP/pyruvate-binding domain-containing protein, partial [Acetobacteraceae bacterium]|nr:PEP/pyruvate-binding domain-containing protein [Acetobacteraceae bacterium]